MTSADGNGDSSSRRASMPAKKTRRSSLFSRQRPSLPSPSPSTLPIGLDPLVNRSAISGRLVHRDDGVSLEGGGIGQQYQESREGQEAQSPGHGEHRSINLSTHSLGLGSKSNSSSQHIPIPDADTSLREIEEVGRLEEGQFVPTAPLPIPIPTSNLSPTLILTPVSDPAPASAPAIASLHITLPPRIEQERQRSAMRTRMPRNKTRRETSLLRKAWNRLTCQPTLPASPIDGHRNPFDRSASSSSLSSSTRLFSSSVPTTTPHHIPLKPSISNPSTGSPSAFTTTTTTTTTAATTPLSSQYPPSSPSSPPLPPPLHSPTFSIQQQQQQQQHNRLHRRPHSSPPPRHRQPQPQPQPQLSV
ncbi:hypothetical protein FRC18_006938 [Serendipita sp. 400]|nr:hypothetical protein FRC18_006938 [Serendipita sp. 400]